MAFLGSRPRPRLAAVQFFLSVFCLSCASCAGSGQGLAGSENGQSVKTNESSSVETLDWGTLGDLSHLQLTFQDTDGSAVVYVTGPYELLYWDEEQIDLIGNLYPDTGAARLTLMQRGDEVWAHVRMPDAEYLTRVE